jgi:hypothetical protein
LLNERVLALEDVTKAFGAVKEDDEAAVADDRSKKIGRRWNFINEATVTSMVKERGGERTKVEGRWLAMRKVMRVN